MGGGLVSRCELAIARQAARHLTADLVPARQGTERRAGT